LGEHCPRHFVPIARHIAPRHDQKIVKEKAVAVMRDVSRDLFEGALHAKVSTDKV
jgi:hypothetical protein